MQLSSSWEEDHVRGHFLTLIRISMVVITCICGQMWNTVCFQTFKGRWRNSYVVKFVAPHSL